MAEDGIMPQTTQIKTFEDWFVEKIIKEIESNTEEYRETFIKALGKENETKTKLVIREEMENMSNVSDYISEQKIKGFIVRDYDQSAQHLFDEVKKKLT